jgi:hypothetical protein
MNARWSSDDPTGSVQQNSPKQCRGSLVFRALERSQETPFERLVAVYCRYRRRLAPSSSRFDRYDFGPVVDVANKRSPYSSGGLGRHRTRQGELPFGNRIPIRRQLALMGTACDLQANPLSPRFCPAQALETSPAIRLTLRAQRPHRTVQPRQT